MFTLTKEKFRMKCKLQFDFTKDQKEIFWAKLSDDDQIAFKSAQPG